MLPQSPHDANLRQDSAAAPPCPQPFTAWRLRACPRCHGDLYRRFRGDDWSCLSCGWTGETKTHTGPVDRVDGARRLPPRHRDPE